MDSVLQMALNFRTLLGIIFHKFATLTCKTPKLLTIYFLILLT